MYKEKKEIPEDEKEVRKRLSKVENKDIPAFVGSMIAGVGEGVLLGVYIGDSMNLVGIGAVGVVAVGSMLVSQIFANKYAKSREEYLADNLKLVRENKYQQMIIDEQQKQILTDEQKEKLQISMATLAYVSTNNYSDFDDCYKTNIKDVLGSEYSDSIEDRFAIHCAYLKAGTSDEFRSNLEDELVSSNNKDYVKRK